MGMIWVMRGCGQDLAGQVTEMQAAGCVKIYREKVSGAKTDRACFSSEGAPHSGYRPSAKGCTHHRARAHQAGYARLRAGTG
jgi:hypothetical protein